MAENKDSRENSFNRIQKIENNEKSIISLIFKNNQLQFPVNEKELLFQPYIKVEDEIYYIALKSVVEQI